MVLPTGKKVSWIRWGWKSEHQLSVWEKETQRKYENESEDKVVFSFITNLTDQQ